MSASVTCATNMHTCLQIQRDVSSRRRCCKVSHGSPSQCMCLIPCDSVAAQKRSRIALRSELSCQAHKIVSLLHLRQRLRWSHIHTDVQCHLQAEKLFSQDNLKGLMRVFSKLSAGVSCHVPSPRASLHAQKMCVPIWICLQSLLAACSGSRADPLKVYKTSTARDSAVNDS